MTECLYQVGHCHREFPPIGLASCPMRLGYIVLFPAQRVIGPSSALKEHRLAPISRCPLLIQRTDKLTKDFFCFFSAKVRPCIKNFQMMTNFKQTYIDALKYYYYVGGMPEAVLSFSEEKDFNEVRSIQKRILDAYEQDFSKHAPVELVPKIRMLWNSISSQLAKENKKFIYGLLWEDALTEQYVCQQLQTIVDLQTYYYTNDRGLL